MELFSNHATPLRAHVDQKYREEFTRDWQIARDALCNLKWHLEQGFICHSIDMVMQTGDYVRDINNPPTVDREVKPPVTSSVNG